MLARLLLRVGLAEASGRAYLLCFATAMPSLPKAACAAVSMNPSLAMDSSFSAPSEFCPHDY